MQYVNQSSYGEKVDVDPPKKQYREGGGMEKEIVRSEQKAVSQISWHSKICGVDGAKRYESYKSKVQFHVLLP